jgi:hypothetical protein
LYKEGDNGNMAKKREVSVQKGIRFPKWMFDRLEKIAEDKKATFTDVVLDLLRQELAAMGCTMGIGREAGEVSSGGNPQKAEKAQ